MYLFPYNIRRTLIFLTTFLDTSCFIHSKKCKCNFKLLVKQVVIQSELLKAIYFKFFPQLWSFGISFQVYDFFSTCGKKLLEFWP